jgi:glyoxylate reductase
MIDGRVFVTRHIHPDAIELLLREFSSVDVWEERTPPSPEQLRERAKGCVALITMVTERVDAVLLDTAPTLKVVANVATGYDNLDLAAATARGVLMSNTPRVLEETTADLTFALMLAVSRRVVEAGEDASAGRWGPWDPLKWLGHDVHHQTLGIVGLGKIGRLVAKRAKGFDMRVLYTARGRHLEDEGKLGVEYVPALPDLLAEADFVSLHVPLSDQTHRLMDEAALHAMKPTAYLINTARGEVVDQEALVQALKEGEIAGAGLDVMTPEPLPADHQLYRFSNVVMTPHIGSATVVTRRRMTIMAVENVVAGCKGTPMSGRLEPLP